MKNTLIVVSIIVSISMLMAFSEGVSIHNKAGAPAGTCGDPAGGGVTCKSCHAGTNLPPIKGVITSTIPAGGYTAGNTYTVTAKFVRAGHSAFGFQISPQDSSTGIFLGTLANISGTQLDNTGKYITHLSSSTSGSGSKTWSFKWTAPATGKGPVTFYGAFNATNNNGTQSGDSIFTSTYVVSENTTSVQDMEKNNVAVSAFPNPTMGKLNVRFYLPEICSVEIQLFDVSGKQLHTLLAKSEKHGEISESFNLFSFPAGIYFIRLNIGGKAFLYRILKI
jgi:hypothetical protein